MILELNKKTGVRAETYPVLILDYKRKKVFYSHKGHEGKDFYFNLPKGKYIVKSKIVLLKNPIPCALPELPKPEKNLIFPKKVKVRINVNKNKASIWTGLNEVLVDAEIFKKTLPEIVFILFHEAGHYLYYDEKKCDLFAVREMLKRGYNPSQCFFAIRDALGDFESSLERKKCIHSKLFKK